MCELGVCKLVVKVTVICWLLVPNLLLVGGEDKQRDSIVSPQRSLGPCFPNPCFYQGVCTVVDGKPNCTCKPGFTGPVCKEMETKVKCKEEYMTMMVRKEAFEMLKVPLVSIHLKNRNCKVLEMYEDGVVFLGAKLTSENHTTCGSQIKVNGSRVSYANMIESDRDDQGVITRRVNPRMVFMCNYAYKGVVSLPFPLRARDTLVQFTVKEGDFVVTMALYDNAAYVQPYSQQPLTLHLEDTLYVLLQMEGQDQVKYFFLTVEDCWGTPESDPNHSMKHQLIVKGCPHDKTVVLLNDIGTSTKAKFSFQMFLFSNLTELFLHCEVRLCIPEKQELCAKQCSSKVKSKRALDDDYKKIVSYGPIRLLAPSPLEARNPNPKENQQSDGSLQLWILGSVALAGFATACVLAAAAKAMKK